MLKVRDNWQADNWQTDNWQAVIKIQEVDLKQRQPTRTADTQFICEACHKRHLLVLIITMKPDITIYLLNLLNLYDG